MKSLSRPKADEFAKELLKSARRKLKNQGLNDAQIDELSESKQLQDRIPILASDSGIVHKLNVQEGSTSPKGDVVLELGGFVAALGVCRYLRRRSAVG